MPRSAHQSARNASRRATSSSSSRRTERDGTPNGSSRTRPFSARPRCPRRIRRRGTSARRRRSMRMTVFLYCSGSTRVRSANASGTVSHFGRKRTGAGTSASGRGRVGRRGAGVRARRGTGAARADREKRERSARWSSGTCIMLQATRSRARRGAERGEVAMKDLGARLDRATCASGSSIATNRPSGRARQSAVSWWCGRPARAPVPQRQARRAVVPLRPCSRSRWASAFLRGQRACRGERPYRRPEALRACEG